MRPSESSEWQLHGKYSTHPSYRTGHLTWLVLQCETLHGWHHNAKPSHLHWAQCEVLHTTHIFKSTTVHYAHMCSIHLRIRMMCGGNQGFADKGELKCNCILYWLCRFCWTGIESSNTLTCATLYMRIAQPNFSPNLEIPHSQCVASPTFSGGESPSSVSTKSTPSDLSTPPDELPFFCAPPSPKKKNHENPDCPLGKYSLITSPSTSLRWET